MSRQVARKAPSWAEPAGSKALCVLRSGADWCCQRTVSNQPVHVSSVRDFLPILFHSHRPWPSTKGSQVFTIPKPTISTLNQPSVTTTTHTLRSLALCRSMLSTLQASSHFIFTTALQSWCVRIPFCRRRLQTQQFGSR